MFEKSGPPSPCCAATSSARVTAASKIAIAVVNGQHVNLHDAQVTDTDLVALYPPIGAG